MSHEPFIDQANILIKLAGIEGLAMYRPYGSSNLYNKNFPIIIRNMDYLLAKKRNNTLVKNKAKKNKDIWKEIEKHMVKMKELRGKTTPLAKDPYWLGLGRPSFIVNNVKFYTSLEEIENMNRWDEYNLNITPHDLVFPTTRRFKKVETLLSAVQKIADYKNGIRDRF